jgi:hypothetical protein
VWQALAMKRRAFIAAGLGAAAVWPLAAPARQSMPVIGFLSSLSPEGALHQAVAIQRAREAGYEGDKVAFEYRWALEQLPEMKAELARRPVDILTIAVPTNPTFPAIAETSQSQDQIVTATASASSESSACSASQGNAYNLCMVRGFYNISGVTCTCTQTGSAGAPKWECVGTATCKK